MTGIYAGAFDSSNVETVSFNQSSVASIPENAFRGCRNLMNIALCGSVSSIGQSAFQGCVLLRNLDLSGAHSLREIGNDAFSGCIAINSVSGTPASLATIGDRAFFGCNNLRTFANAVGLVSIGTSAFKQCSLLSAFKFGPNFTDAGESAFEGCSGLTNVAMSESRLEGIGAKAFKQCSSLTAIVLPASVTNIAPSAFETCSKIRSFTIAADNAVYCSVNGIIFTKDMTTLVAYPSAKQQKEVSIPEGVESVGDYAFMNAVGIEYITMPASVRSLGDFSFQGCGGLESVIFRGSGLITIGISAFNGCNNLSKFDFPATLVSIGSNAFGNCAKLKVIDIKSPVSIGDMAFYGVVNAVSVYVADGSNVAANAFVGFKFYDNSGTEEPSFQTGHRYAGTSSINLSENKCAIIYYFDGQIYGSIEFCDIGTEVAIRTVPVKAGYSVSGWVCEGTDISSGRFTAAKTAVIETFSEKIVTPSDIDSKDGKSIISVAEDSAIIQQDTVQAIAGDSVLNIGDVSITLPAESLARISNGREFSVSAKTSSGIQNIAALAKLTDEERIYAADALVIDFDFGCFGELSDLGTVTVKVPYNPGDMPISKLAVYFIAEDGTLTKMESSYENGFVTFTTDHFSTYSVGRTYESQEPYHPGEDHNINTLILVGSISIFVIVAIAAAVMWKKRQ